MRKPMLAVVLLLLGTVHAQGLPDPTRPPGGLDAVQAGAAGTPPAPTGLQTIVQRAGARPAAVINGEYVELGGKVGDAKLVKIGDDSVVLQSATGREILHLTPGIEKKLMVKQEKKARKRRPQQKSAQGLDGK